MGTLRINKEAIIGNKELSRFKTIAKEKGFKKLFDLIGNKGRVRDFSNDFSVSTSGGLNIEVETGLAISSDLDSILNEAVVTLTDTGGGALQYHAMAYNTTSKEAGTLSVAADGTVTGTGTLFSEVLRGQPYAPSKITLFGATLTGGYEVIHIEHPASATIAETGGTTETAIQYEVFGTFNPIYKGLIQPSDFTIFEYDFVVFAKSTVSMAQAISDAVTAAPSGVTEGFGVCTSQDDTGGTLVSGYPKKYTTPADYLMTKMESRRDATLTGVTTNPLFHIISAQYSQIETQSSGVDILFSWGLNVNGGNYTYDDSARKMYINDIRYVKDTLNLNSITFNQISDLAGIDFTGWYVAQEGTGKTILITSSAIVNDQLELSVAMEYNEDDWSNQSDIHVVPPYDNFMIKMFMFNTWTEEAFYSFDMKEGFATVNLSYFFVLSATPKNYTIKSAMSNGAGTMQKTDWVSIPNDIFYYAERDFLYVWNTDTDSYDAKLKFGAGVTYKTASNGIEQTENHFSIVLSEEFSNTYPRFRNQKFSYFNAIRTVNRVTMMFLFQIPEGDLDERTQSTFLFKIKDEFSEVFPDEDTVFLSVLSDQEVPSAGTANEMSEYLVISPNGEVSLKSLEFQSVLTGAQVYSVFVSTSYNIK